MEQTEVVKGVPLSNATNAPSTTKAGKLRKTKLRGRHPHVASLTHADTVESQQAAEEVDEVMEGEEDESNDVMTAEEGWLYDTHATRHTDVY